MVLRIPKGKPVSAVMFGLMFVAFACVLGMAAAAPAWIPVHVVRGNDDVLRVTFSPVDMALRSLEPARYPMFNDLLTATRTPGQRTLTIAEIERELTEKSADSGPGWFENGAQTPHTYARPHPAGFIFHEARVGSTLAANMLSSVPNTLVYSECGAVADFLRVSDFLSRDERIRQFRVLVAAMARVPGFTHMYFKFQSVLTRNIDVITSAYPDTPWVFLYRNAVENIVSNFRNGRHSGACMKPLPQYMLDRLKPDDVRAAPERFCAAYIEDLRQAVLRVLPTSHGKGAVLNYASMPDGFVSVMNRHFGMPLPDAVIKHVAETAAVYSKARERSSDAAFGGDTELKLEKATTAIVDAVKEFTAESYAQLDVLSFTGSRTLSDGVPEAYPRLFSLADILTAWNPDDVAIPASYGQYSSLAVFDYQDDSQRSLAEQFRKAEVPFVVRNVPAVNDVMKKWTPEYLTEQAGPRLQRAEANFKNHFMYYRGKDGPDKPTSAAPMSYSDWRQALLNHERDPEHYPYVYMTISGGQGNTNKFIPEDLTIFKNEKSFFVVDPVQQAGIHCRFGMAGIIAETHWDTGRNFIAVVNGTRRYILSPPSECSKLFILDSGPSARHSSVDWSDPAVIPTLAEARAVEVVLSAGDVLYLPALYFHYIISLTPNIQCNTRSGTPDVDEQSIVECGGVRPRSSERGTVDAISANRAALPTLAPPATARLVSSAVDATYPEMFPLKDILAYWNPDNVTIPASYGRYSSLKHFDYQTELEQALVYRNAEVPFVIRNVPNLEETGHKWSDAYLTDITKGFSTRTEMSKTNHFMYYHGRSKDKEPPTVPVKMTFPEWREAARKVERNESQQLYYLTMTGYSKKDFIGRDLSMFSSYPTFFVKDAQQQRGIHCRFGMPSIIAESHYDGGRNFIAMVRGKKRYILNHPNQCTKLHMMKTGMSARHSEIDWSDPNNFELFGDATGLEVVLEAGDVLFLPALWFHYIVSLEVNIQCNTRSGTPATYSDDIRKCGFSVFVTEGGKQGRLTPLEAENLKTEAPPVLRGSAGESVSGDLQFMVQDAVDSTPVAAGAWVVLVVLLVSSVIVFGVYLRRRLVSQPFQVNNHAKLGPSGRR